MEVTKNAPVTQQANAFIAGQIYGDNSIRSDISILSPGQAVSFLNDNDYNRKACVSLNQIFVPYTTDTDNSGTMPIGYPQFQYTNYGVVTTVDDTLDSNNISVGNVGNALLNAGHNHRSIGINKETLFIGPSGTPNGQNTFSGMVGGPLDIAWDSGIKKWKANVTATPTTEFWMGYVMDISIDAPASMGDYTEFTTTFGECRNYDTGFSKSPSTNVFVIAVKSSGIPMETSGLHMTYSGGLGNTYFLPLYIGCGA